MFLLIRTHHAPDAALALAMNSFDSNLQRAAVYALCSECLCNSGAVLIDEVISY